jgi:hypothetical protein
MYKKTPSSGQCAKFKAAVLYAQMPPSSKKETANSRVSFLIRKRLFAKVALEVANVMQAIVIATFKHGRSGTQLWLFVRQGKKGANIQI